jgi:hypothetical protein
VPGADVTFGLVGRKPAVAGAAAAARTTPAAGGLESDAARRKYPAHTAVPATRTATDSKATFAPRELVNLVVPVVDTVLGDDRLVRFVRSCRAITCTLPFRLDIAFP